ncbi:NUDIX hydrolase [Hamadaea tsunoensis]|uniref:NUDIX hydrolase n=1 Tax=Hamadaea tsunoensis TaxID=53368 RepID=UPI001FE14C91|nr:NUDIX domain-containing protein [Hamadaea tsunoensis]
MQELTEAVAARQPTPRRAGRVLLVDAQERVLLFQGFDPAVPEVRFWFTPGGGLEPGESPAEGAARELAEETGLRIDPADLGAPVHSDVTEFSFSGTVFRQEQDFYLLRVASWTVDTAGFDEVERRTVQEHRWWSGADLASAEDAYYPPALIDILRKALAPC